MGCGRQARLGHYPESHWSTLKAWAEGLNSSLIYNINTDAFDVDWGYNNWRLSNINEISHLYFTELGLNESFNTPAKLNAGEFDNLVPTWHWSSTEFSNPGMVWGINFDDGYKSPNPINDLNGSALAIRNAYVSPARPAANAMLVPASAEILSPSPVALPIINIDPNQAIPFAVGDLSSGNLNLQVGLPAFSSGVDIYLAIGFGDALFLVDSSNGLQSSAGLTALPKWKTNNTAAINESLYGDIPTSLLPAGVYNLYTLVVPAGETDFSHYYFWATDFSVGT